MRVRYDNVEVLTYASLDSGSSLSFCSRKLINVLGANESGAPTKVRLETLTTNSKKNIATKVFDFQVLSLIASNKFKLSNVIMVDKVSVDLGC